MKCCRCKREIDIRSIYCMYCGANQIDDKQPRRSVKKRGNGTGSVYKLPNDKWACARTWYIGGKRKTVCKKGFTTQKEANEYLSSLDKKRNKTITIAQAYEALKPTFEKLSEKRQKTYESAYKHLKDVEMVNVDAFELSDLQNIIDDVDGGFYTKRYIKDLLNKIFTYAYIDGKVERNVVPHIVLPKNEASEKTVFTEPEINLLWHLWNSGEEFSGYLLILLYCALRTGELWNIECANVDLEKHIMFGGIKTAKGKKAPIFIIRKIEPVVRHFAENNATTLYPGNATAFYREWQDFKSAHKLREELQPYSARHTCATLLAKAGVPEAVIMDITRHTSYDTTLKYTHIDTDSVLDNMDRALNGV